jgi:hypothetical protein
VQEKQAEELTLRIGEAGASEASKKLEREVQAVRKQIEEEEAKEEALNTQQAKIEVHVMAILFAVGYPYQSASSHSVHSNHVQLIG